MKSVGVKAGAVLLGLLLLLGSGVMAFASSYTAYIVPSGTTGNQDFNGSLGMDFDVNMPIVVTSLGAFDSGQDGFQNAITVALFNRVTEQIVGSTVTFTGTPSLEGGSSFQTITPIPLPAGFQGSIVASGYNASEPNGNAGIFSPPSPNRTMDDGGGLISFVGYGRWDNTQGIYPRSVDTAPPNRYAAGTFQYSAVPIPGALWLFSSGLVGLVGIRRRVKK